MSDHEAKRGADTPIAATIAQEILRAVARIEYGSVEVVIHDGKVVLIECKEKIRMVRDDTGHKTAVRQVR